MNILPLAITAAGAIPSLIGGIMNAVLAGKKLSGGRLRRRRIQKKKGKGGRILRLHKKKGGRLHKKRYAKKGKGGAIRKRVHRRKGKGVIADTLGSVPLLGALLGPLAKAFGGRLKRMPKRNRRAYVMALARRLRGQGLSAMYIRRPYVSSGCGLSYRTGTRGRGLSPMYIRRPYCGGRLAPIGADYKIASKTYLTPSLAMAALKPFIGTPSPLLGPMNKKPFNFVPAVVPPPASWGTSSIMPSGRGLLFPAGRGGMMVRKGHLRKIKGRAQKVRVKPSVVGRGLLSPAGGYIPYHGRYGVFGRTR